MRFRLTLKAPHEGQDNFFLWTLVFLPIIAECAYVYEAYYYLAKSLHRHYQGLFSTILVVFTYLRYGAPIESPKLLGLYYIILFFLNEAGTVGYLAGYIRHKDIYNIAIYSGWVVLEAVMTSSLIYYRVFKHCHPNFHLENKNLFQFISRLEVILAIFIPFFLANESVTLTKHSIAFFLLFDFFAESYHRFQGFWIKAILYIFVCTVTVCVVFEWLYSYKHVESHEIISSVAELISACLCDVLIIFQFIPYHFKTAGISDIARKALAFRQNNATELQIVTTDPKSPATELKINPDDIQTIEIIAEPTYVELASKDAVIDVEL